MADQRDVQVNINVIDQTKAGTQSAAQNIGQVTQAAQKVGKESQTSSSSLLKMAGAVAGGIGIWTAASQAISGTINFIEDSIKAGSEAELKTNQMINVVRSMGKEYEAQIPLIQDFSGKMAKMGRDDEDVALATAKLAKLLGGDFNQAMRLTKGASDLTASGFGNFEDNVENLSNILIGKGDRALKAYKLNLNDNATTTDQLNAVLGQVTTTTEEWAETTDGKIAIVKVGFENIKESVGQGLTGAFRAFTSETMGNLSLTVGSTETLRKTLIKLGFEAAQVATIMIEGFKAAYNGIAAPVKAVVKLMQGEFKAAVEEIDKGGQAASDSWNKVKEAVDKAANTNLDEMVRKQDEAASAARKLAEEQAKSAYNAEINARNMATSSKNTSDALIKLGDTYKDLQVKGKDALVKLADDQAEELQKVRDDIAKTKDSIKELTQAYNQEQKDDTKSVAEEIVAAQQRVAEIQKELSGQVADDRRTELQKELQNTQNTLSANSTFIQSISADVSAAQVRASKTNLQRAIDDFNTKRQLAKQEYDEKMQKLQDELNAQQQHELSMMILYAQKEAEIKKIMDQATTDYQATLETRKKLTLDSVKAEIEMFNQLATAISRASSGKTSSLNVTVSGSRAQGGPVLSGQAYLVGEEGPEVFVPSQSGKIISNQNTKNITSNSPVSIVINYPNFSSQAGMNSTIQDIIRAVNKADGRKSELYRMGALT